MLSVNVPLCSGKIRSFKIPKLLISMVGWRQGKEIQQLSLWGMALCLGQPTSFSWDFSHMRNAISSFLGRAHQRSCGQQSPWERRAAQRAWPGTLQEAAAVVVSALGELQVSLLFLCPECSCESLIACAAVPHDLPSNSIWRRYLFSLARIVATN